MIGHYQGRGHGRKAFEVLIKKAQMDIACKSYYCRLWVEMKKMKHLLTSLGFQETGFIEENKEVFMRLDLKKEWNRMTKSPNQRLRQSGHC